MFSAQDLALFEELDLPKKAVAVAVRREKPEGLGKLDSRMRLCDMVSHAQRGHCFYSDPSNHTCEAALWVLGYDDPPQSFTSGDYAYELGGYRSSRAGSRIYDHNPVFAKHQLNFVAFAPVEKANFEPDVLLITTDAKQTHTVLRATAFDDGRIITSYGTLSAECCWWLAYPYVTGNVNYLIGSVGFGSHRAKNWDPGEVVIAIPMEKWERIAQTIKDMARPGQEAFYGESGLEFKRQLRVRLGLDPANAD